MAKSQLGEFEELILTMVVILEHEAYGNSIVRGIMEQLNREVNLSAVHITLYRLEEKGYVQSEMRGATASRGGRRKRYFRITGSGMKLLYALQEQRQKLWKLMPQFKLKTS